MTRLQEAQEWAARLIEEEAAFYDCEPSLRLTTIGSILYDWEWLAGNYDDLDLNTRLLALAFAATAPKEFRLSGYITI